MIKFFKNIGKLNELFERVETHKETIIKILSEIDKVYEVIKELKDKLKN